MNAKTIILIFYLSIGLCINTCVAGEVKGPGMWVFYRVPIPDTRIFITVAHLPNGEEFHTIVSFASMKVAYAGRNLQKDTELPEWIEFEWQEIRKSSIEVDTVNPYEDLDEKIIALQKATPVKKQRVFIRNRIPKDVANEVMESNKIRLIDKPSEKSLRIELVWTESGIKLHWKLWHIPIDGPQSFLREGGDDVTTN